MWHRFSDIGRESPIWTYPHLYLGWPCRNFAEIFGVRKRVPGLSCGVVCVILCLAVLVQCRLGTDRQTDRRTNRRTDTPTAYTALQSAGAFGVYKSQFIASGLELLNTRSSVAGNQQPLSREIKRRPAWFTPESIAKFKCISLIKEPRRIKKTVVDCQNRWLLYWYRLL